MKPLSKNFLSIFVSDIGRRVLGFFTIAYLTRRIGVAEFGALNIGLTVLSCAQMVSSGGLSSFGTRAVARSSDLPMVSKVVSLRVASSAVAWILVTVIAVSFVPNPLTARLIAAFSFSLFANGLLLDWYFQGKEEMAIIGIGRLVSAGIYLAFIIRLVHSSADLLLVAIAAVAGDFAMTGLLLIRYRRENKIGRAHV